MMARREQAKGFVWGGTLQGRLEAEKARLLRALRELPGLDSVFYEGREAAEADISDQGYCAACGRCRCACLGL